MAPLVEVGGGCVGTCRLWGLVNKAEALPPLSPRGARPSPKRLWGRPRAPGQLLVAREALERHRGQSGSGAR